MKNENNHPALLAVALSAVKALQARGADLPLAHHTHLNVISGILDAMAKKHNAPDDVKVVAYFGRTYLVSAEVKFIATDGDDAVYAYINRPDFRQCGDYWIAPREGDYIRLGDLPDHLRDFDYGASLVEV